MRRRDFIAVVGGAAATWPLAARAQHAGIMRRVGVLMNGAATEAVYQSYLTAFVQELRELGWTEGQNVRIEVRWNAGDAALARIYAAQLLGLMPDVILSSSTVNLTAVREATSTVPVVFVNVADPVAQGFVSNMRQPGGNITGFSMLEFSLASKWLNLLKEIAPDLNRVAVMFNPGTGPYFKFFLPVFNDAALPLSVQVITLPVLTESDIEPALAEFAREANSGLILLGESFTRLHIKEIADSARRYRLPSIAPNYLASAGGLVDYGPVFDLTRHFAQAATYVDRILKGAAPGDLPVQTPTQYKLAVNLKTAKALGLTVPPSLLATADQVIE